MAKRPIDKTLDAFILRDLQTFKVILQTLSVDGWEIKDAIKEVDRRTREYDAPIRVLQRRCPQCEDQWLTLGLVNHHPAGMIGGDWKCQWLCPMCEYEELSAKDIEEEAKPYIASPYKEDENGNR